jgi:hypothetical protein
MSSNTSSSDVLRRYRTYDAPPDGFDPRRAPQEVLLHHGLPRRPDPAKEPELARLWEQAFARPTKFIKAELAIDPVIRSHPRFLANAPDDPPIPAGQWGGAAVVTITSGVPPQHPITTARTIAAIVHTGGARPPTPPIPSGPATMVFAQWVVPTVLAKNPAGKDLKLGFWVGLDGFGTAGGELLQAGILAKTSYDGGDAVWTAFTEWWDPVNNIPAVDVPNFPVAPGDTVCFLLCAPQPNFGYVSMLNLSQGVHTSKGIVAPPGVISIGATAEWVIEALNGALPYFYSVEFSNCLVGTQSQQILNLTHGIPFNITSAETSAAPYGKTLTNAYIDSPTRVVVLWEGFD